MTPLYINTSLYHLYRFVSLHYLDTGLNVYRFVSPPFRVIQMIQGDTVDMRQEGVIE